LDGLYTRGTAFVDIAALFAQAKAAIETDQFTTADAMHLSTQIQALHPQNRGLDTGFYSFDRDDIK